MLCSTLKLIFKGVKLFRSKITNITICEIINQNTNDLNKYKYSFRLSGEQQGPINRGQHELSIVSEGSFSNNYHKYQVEDSMKHLKENQVGSSTQ